MVYSRAWELLIGSLLAILISQNKFLVTVAWANNLIAAFGLLAIAISIFYLDDDSNFPGYAALGAALGAGAIIYSGSARLTMVSTVLSSNIFRSIGLISYSLYLWHWPIWVYSRTADFFWLTHGPVKLVLVAFSIFIAYLSWRFIEQPFRKRREIFTNKNVLIGGILVMALACVGGYGLRYLNVTFFPKPPMAEKVNEYLTYRQGFFYLKPDCVIPPKLQAYNKRQVCLNLSSEKDNILILGDSFAEHLIFGLDKTYPNANFLYATTHGCRPIKKPRGRKLCVDLVNFVLDEFIIKNDIDSIIIAGRWRDNDANEIIEVTDYLQKHVKQVFVVGPPVEYEGNLPNIISNAIINGENIKQYANKYKNLTVEKTDSDFSQRLKGREAIYLPLYEILNNQCNTPLINEVPIQFDYGHFTDEGSLCVAQAFKLNQYIK